MLLVERDPLAVRHLRAATERLAAAAVQVDPGDGIGALARAGGDGAYDLVFLDPPFDAVGVLAKALAAAALAVVPGGYVYVEGPTPLTEWPAGLETWRQGRAGSVHFGLLRRSVP